MWDPNFAKQILQFSNSKDAFAIALMRLGYSINTEDQMELDQAAQLLKEQKPLVQAYVMDQILIRCRATRQPSHLIMPVTLSI